MYFTAILNASMIPLKQSAGPDADAQSSGARNVDQAGGEPPETPEGDAA